MSPIRQTLGRAALSSAIVLLTTSGAWAAPLQTVDSGQALYRSKGCYECHGAAAQGAMGVAPPLKPLHLPINGFLAYVQRPGGQMPPYSATLLSRAEATAIFDYLKALPASRTAADVPLLAPFVSSTPPAKPPVPATLPAKVSNPS